MIYLIDIMDRIWPGLILVRCLENMHCIWPGLSEIFELIKSKLYVWQHRNGQFIPLRASAVNLLQWFARYSPDQPIYVAD